MKKLYLLAIALLSTTTALADSAAAPIYRLNCKFQERVAKDELSTCRAELVLRYSFKLKCDHRPEQDLGQPLDQAHSLTDDIGITVISAIKPNTNEGTYPAIYVDNDIFLPNFKSGAANLRFGPYGSALHGTCEKGEAQ